MQVVIGRPVIIPALSEQLNQQQAECLDQITKFIQQYDQNLEQRLRESAIAGGEQLAAQLLEELSDWEPGRKPVQFKKKMERHLMKVQVLLANADPEAGSSLEAIAANTAKFSGAELETLASEAALLAFDEDRPQQVTLADLEACRQTITPLAIQDAAAVSRMREWASTARRASSAVVAAKTQSLRAAKFRNLN